MSRKIVVSKFGGTSMANKEAMLRSAEIAKNRGSCIVCVSATSGTTNLIIKLAELATLGTWEECDEILYEIEKKHHSIAKDLKVSEEVWKKIQGLIHEVITLARGINLLGERSDRAMDKILSCGERMSSTLFTCAMNKVLPKPTAQWLDVRKIMKTDSVYGKAVPNVASIRNACEKNLKDLSQSNDVFITQGFIGSNDQGITTTLGRGGSDYSAALLAEGVQADLLEIWTDVAGIATTDPRICPQAQPIKTITFKEASELAVFGAKILHPTTLVPAKRSGIPVYVGSSYEPEKSGTRIGKKTDETPLVRAMALRKKQTLLKLENPTMLKSHDFMFNVFQVFNNYKESVDAINTSEISIAMTVNDDTVNNELLISDLKKIAKVKMDRNLNLVSLIGNNINLTPGLGKTIFNSLEDINVRMICLGASKHNFNFLVDSEQGEEAIKRLHHIFIEKN